MQPATEHGVIMRVCGARLHEIDHTRFACVRAHMAARARDAASELQFPAGVVEHHLARRGSAEARSLDTAPSSMT